MRHAPTLTFVAVLAVLVGCAADATEPGTKGSETSTPSGVTIDDSDGGAPPAFDAHFAPDGGAGPAATTPTTTASCKDPDDPGATEPLAKQLPDTDDCNDDDIPQTGILVSASDTDMYKLTGKDTFWCHRDTKFKTETPGVQLCVFARCANSTVDPVSGCNGGVEATSDLGWKGCCTDGPGEATPKWDCKGWFNSDSADFFIRVKPTTANVCVDYAFSYVF